MRRLLCSVGALNFMIIVSASAQTADSHAGHHSADSAKPPSQDTEHRCQMMIDKTSQAQKPNGATPSPSAQKNYSAKDHMEHCMGMHPQDHEAGMQRPP